MCGAPAAASPQAGGAVRRAPAAWSPGPWYRHEGLSAAAPPEVMLNRAATLS